jgi:glycosyltransferase involved in cell wall biosynthesis
LISVVIPTYDRARCLDRAVESVIAQSYTDREIIIIDDGSLDDTPAVVERMMDAYGDEAAIRFSRIPHAGVSAARNRGIDMSRGEWIAFLDSDDHWLPDKLDRQVRYLAAHPEYRVCHTDEIWIRKGTRINQGKKHLKRAGWFFIPSLELCLISPSAVMVHRSVFREVGVFDETFPVVEDYDLWLRMTARYPVGYVDEKLVVKTGGRPDQLSASIDGIEGYRLRALEKMLRSGTLDGEFMDRCLDTFRRKASIYTMGCAKRGKHHEIVKFRKLVEEMESIAGGVTTA